MDDLVTQLDTLIFVLTGRSDDVVLLRELRDRLTAAEAERDDWRKTAVFWREAWQCGFARREGTDG